MVTASGSPLGSGLPRLHSSSSSSLLLLLRCSSLFSSQLFFSLAFAVAFFVMPSAHSYLTLKPFQVQTCLGDSVRLQCPQSTYVTITQVELAISDRSRDSVCNSRQNYQSSSVSVMESGSKTESPPNCESASVDLKKRFTTLCGLRHRCTLNPREVEDARDNSCQVPNTLLRISFKCRPKRLHSKVVCIGKRLHLRCQKSAYIVIYESAFELRTEPEPSVCQGNGIRRGSKLERGEEGESNPESCTLNVMQIATSLCQGKRKCSLDSGRASFVHQSTCLSSKSHLKVVYACVSKSVVNYVEEDENNGDFLAVKPKTSDAPLNPDVGGSFGKSVEKAYHTQLTSIVPEESESEKLKADVPFMINSSQSVTLRRTTEQPRSRQSSQSVSSVVPPQRGEDMKRRLMGDNQVPKATSTVCNCSYMIPIKKAIGFLSDWVSATVFIKENLERLILYILVSVLAALVALLLVVSCRCFYQKHRILRLLYQEGSPITVFTDIDNTANLVQSPEDGIGAQLTRQGLSSLTIPSSRNRRSSDNGPRISLEEESMTTVVGINQTETVQNHQSRVDNGPNCLYAHTVPRITGRTIVH